MMSAENGGPAFPTHENADVPGMSLRDWFAGQALAGYLGSCSPDRALPKPDHIAGEVYGIADAMLAARRPTPDSEDVG